jgi:2-desacetyl-2-hydroxyethyl bacteriochlorophyllide A dehydrogenase
MVMMQAAVFRGAQQIEVIQVPKPEPNPDEALIRIAYCGICGSDVEAYHTGMYEPGMIIGHEFSGTIEAVGGAVTGWHTGDHVVVNDVIPCGECRNCREGWLDACENTTLIGLTSNGGFAEYTTITARGLHRLPDSMTLRQGALVEPLAVALHGVRKSRLKPGDHALIMGAGPIGLLTLQCARLAGARTVTVTEVDETRAKLAQTLGATRVLDPRHENVGLELAGLTGQRGPDVIYVCTGAPAAFSDAVSLARKGGQIFVVGVSVEPVEADFLTVAVSELCIEGSFAGRREFPAAIDFIAGCRVNVDALVSHEIGLQELVTEGFERLCQKGGGAVKILARIGGAK